VPDPARVPTAALLDRLVLARTMFGEQQARSDARWMMLVMSSATSRIACTVSRSSDVMPAWRICVAAAQALQAVCGQSTLLGQPANELAALLGSPALEQESARDGRRLRLSARSGCGAVQPIALLKLQHADPTRTSEFGHTRDTHPTET